MKKLAETSTEQWLDGLELALLESHARRVGSGAPSGSEELLEGELADGDGFDAKTREELERLTRGELEPARLEALQARSETDAALRWALEAHQPLGAAAVERFSQRLLQAGAASGPHRIEQRLEAGPAARAVSSPAVSSPVSYARAQRRWARAAWAAVPALAAAAVLVFALRSPSLPPLGAYRVEVSGTVAESRGSPGGGQGERAQREALRVVSGGPIGLLLRPDVPDAQGVDARVFFEQGGERRALGASLERAASGALRLGVLLPAFDAPTPLWVIVARPGVSLPDALAAPADSGPGWQRFGFVLEPAAER